MAINFAVDSVKLKDASVEINNVIEELRLKTTEIYNIIDNDLIRYWNDDSYLEFKDGCHSYKRRIEELSENLDYFSKLFNDNGIDVENMVNSLEEMI